MNQRPFREAAFRTIDGKVWPSGPFHDVSVLPDEFELESEGFVGFDNRYYTREEATKMLQAASPVQSEQLKFANPEGKVKTHNSPLQGGDAIAKSEGMDSFDRRVRKWLVSRKVYRSKMTKGEGGGKVPPNFLAGLRSVETYLKIFDDRPEFKAARTLSRKHPHPQLLHEALGLYSDPFEQALHAHGLEVHDENKQQLQALVHAHVGQLAKSVAYPDEKTWLAGMNQYETPATRMLKHPDPRVRAKALRYPDLVRPHPDTPEFKAWFEGSHVTDHENKPRIVFHGTRANFDTFDLAKLGAATDAPSAKLGFFFAGRTNTAQDYTNIVLPHEKEEHDAMFDRAVKLKQSWSRSHSRDPKRKAAAQAKYDEANTLYTKAHQMRTAGGNIMPVYLSLKNPHVHDMGGKPYRDKSYADIIQHAKVNGHDGVIIRNTYDAALGDAMPDDIYVAFHPHQIKSALSNSGQYSPTDPNITKSEELAKKDPELSTSSAQPVDNPAGRKSDFVVTHNLTQSNLEHADQLGGLVAPSLAVAHRDHPLEGFGDVVLVAHPDMIDPKNGTPVFDADIYSPRHPKARYNIDDKKFYALRNELYPHMQMTGGYSSDLGDHIEENGRFDVSQDHHRAWPVLASAFLASRGQTPAPVMRQARLDNRWDAVLTTPAMKEFVDKIGLGDANFQHRGDWHKLLSAALKQGAQQADDKLRAANVIEPNEKLYDDGHLFDEDDGLVHYGYADGIRRDLQKLGQQEVDGDATRDALIAEIAKRPRGEFQAFVDSKINPTIKGRYIPNGFTAAGNRRRIPYTLDNVLKLMTQKTKGGENFNYGVGSIRAQGAKKFNSLDEIRAHGHRLVSKQDMESVKKEHDETFGRIADAIRPYHNDPGGFRVLDALSSAMAESQKRGRSVALELARDGFNKVPTHIVQQIRDFLKKLNSSPTEYFEAKPQRVVKLGEFKGAAVPHDADPAFIKKLKDKGLHVELYDRNTDDGEHEFKRAWDEAKAVGASDKEADAAGVRARDAYRAKPNGPGSRSEAIRKIADMQKLHLSEKDIVDAVNTANDIAEHFLSKSDLEIPGLMPQSIKPMGVGAEKVAADLSEAVHEGLCYDVVLEGKHSAGSKLIYDEPAHRFWLLKPGSGHQSPASGLAETKGSQAEREVAFSKIALECFDVAAYPQAVLLDIDGAQVAAVAMAAPTYVAAQDLGDTVMNQFLRERLDGGDLHKWAIIDYVLGNTDSHGHNMLVEQDENKVLLIDHGSSFAGYDFAPGRDPNTFMPYYLRVWNSLDWKSAQPEQLYAAMPQPQPGLDAELASWLRGVSQHKIKKLMDAFGLEDGGAAIGRLAVLQDSETPGADVIALWAGLDSMQKSEPEALDLPFATARTQNEVFETGTPVTFQYGRNTIKSPNLGEQFQQHIEPHGRYMIHLDEAPDKLVTGWETGRITLHNPLVIHWNTGVDPYKDGRYNENSWKAHLHRAFGAKGKALSNKIAARGHDGIVTVWPDGQPSEIVDLSMFSNRLAKGDLVPFPTDKVTPAKRKRRNAEIVDARPEFADARAEATVQAGPLMKPQEAMPSIGALKRYDYTHMLPDIQQRAGQTLTVEHNERADHFLRSVLRNAAGKEIKSTWAYPSTPAETIKKIPQMEYLHTALITHQPIAQKLKDYQRSKARLDSYEVQEEAPPPTVRLIDQPSTQDKPAAPSATVLPFKKSEPVRPTSDLPSDDGFFYHATNEERAHDIAERGLLLHKPHEFTDQQTWPDGATEKRNYFSPKASSVWAFAPEEGNPVILRVHGNNHPMQRESTGDFYSRKPVHPDHLEILADGGWQPLKQWSASRS